ncbi:MAG: Gfo/Idh/MocA family oxidoreductase [Candidatus Korarchaeota archaeon]|nr:Gfo/Idh/MocA family oxidoreductase [Candidatus Korarchaeota archaeon]
MTVKVGVIGCGWFGSAHARVYKALGNAQLVAVVDREKSYARRLGELYHVNYYTSLEEMVSRENPDAVSIAVTPQNLFEVTKQALEEGLSVLVEKPIVSSETELRDLERLLNRHNAIFMPGFIEIFNPAVEKLKGLISEGKVGDILSLWSRRVGRLPKKSIGWKIGVSLDLAIHEMYVQIYVLGSPPLKISSYTAKLLNGEGGEDLAIFISKFPEGVTSTIAANWLTPSGLREMLVMGTEGSIMVDYPNQSIKIETTDKTEQPRIRKEEPLRGELSYFIEHVKNGEDPEIGFRYARDVLNTLFTGLRNKLDI